MARKTKLTKADNGSKNTPKGTKKVIITWDTSKGGLLCTTEGFENPYEFIFTMLQATTGVLQQEVEGDIGSVEAAKMVLSGAYRLFLSLNTKEHMKNITTEEIEELLREMAKTTEWKGLTK